MNCHWFTRSASICWAPVTEWGCKFKDKEDSLPTKPKRSKEGQQKQRMSTQLGAIGMDVYPVAMGAQRRDPTQPAGLQKASKERCHLTWLLKEEKESVREREVERVFSVREGILGKHKQRPSSVKLHGNNCKWLAVLVYRLGDGEWRLRRPKRQSGHIWGPYCHSKMPDVFLWITGNGGITWVDL